MAEVSREMKSQAQYQRHLQTDMVVPHAANVADRGRIGAGGRTLEQHRMGKKWTAPTPNDASWKISGMSSNQRAD